MKYDFDTFVDRTGTNCLKFDFAVERGMEPDVLSLWVADMDFRTAQPIIDRLTSAAAHGIYGYSDTKDDYVQAINSWYGKHFGFKFRGEWLVKTPGVVFALAAAVRAYTEEGDGVIIQQPVYYPFSDVIRNNNRKIVDSPLKKVGDRYEMDFEDFEQKVIANKVKMFILCSPHNPVGRVWTKEELGKITDICIKHDVLIVCDEIHADYVWGDNKQTVLLSLSEEVAQHTILCTAPSKTFNLAGLQVSNIFIPNEELRKKFVKAVYKAGYDQVGIMGIVACKAAYEEGEEWYEQVKEYIYANMEYAADFVNTRLPGVKLYVPEGTYLLWLDFTDLGLSNEELEHIVVDKAKLWLDAGAIFGKVGEGYERINAACQRSTLTKALEQLEKALKE